ncbi:MAG: hypothetical protein HKN76_03215, partial [Saprospiraceae bacterium]|nr:hypothetical protein [Saprospiraceae bacterium]
NDSGEQALIPLDPIQALLENPICHSVFLSSAIIDRAFVLDLGGFSTAWRFGADSEFIRRAVFGGIVKNISDRLYFRRIHPASLTHHHLTGFGSPERIRIQKIVQKSGLEIVTAVKSGRNPDLAPVAVGQTAELLYVCGPRPNWI